MRTERREDEMKLAAELRAQERFERWIKQRKGKRFGREEEPSAEEVEVEEETEPEAEYGT